MKANFKKLALVAGVTAAMAGGSMSAHAVIQSAPGQAQLVPLFFWNGNSYSGANTVVRVTVPKSLGANTVVNLLNPGTSPTSANEADGDSDLSPVIENPTTYLEGGNNNQPLNLNGLTNTANAIDATAFPNSFIHWYFLDVRSNHVANGKVPVSQDDAVILSANCLGNSGAIPPGKYPNVYADFLGCTTTAIPENTAGYLVLINESARNGGEALFGFSADAWLVNNGGNYQVDANGVPLTVRTIGEVVNIPTLAMNDGVDQTAFPTPTNQVIESQSFTVGNTYPVVSPLTTGIKTGVLDATAQIEKVELPLADRRNYANQVVVWNDRNGLTVQAEEVNQDEIPCSTTITLPNQLQVYNVNGFNQVPSVVTPFIDLTTGFPKTALADTYSYSAMGVRTKGTSLYVANSSLCQDVTATRDGFVKLYVSKNKAPTGATGPYSSMFAFTIPLWNPAYDGQAPLSLSVTAGQRPTLIAKELGWFTAR